MKIERKLWLKHNVYLNNRGYSVICERFVINYLADFPPRILVELADEAFKDSQEIIIENVDGAGFWRMGRRWGSMYPAAMLQIEKHFPFKTRQTKQTLYFKICNC